MSVALLGAVLGLSGYYRDFPHLIRIGDPLVLLFGPLLYYCIHIATKGSLPRRYLWHLTPFLLYIIWLIPFYALSGVKKIAFVETVFLNKTPPLQAIPIQLFRTVHITVYVIVCLVLIRRFESMLKDKFSNIEKISLDKSAYLLKLIVFILVLSVVIFMIGSFLEFDLILINNLVGLVISGVIYAIVYDKWNRPGTLSSSIEETDRRMYNLSDDQFKVLAENLERLLYSDKVYLQNELSLTQLSERLGIPPYQTSEVISRKYQEPFFDLINRCRIEDVKKKLEDPAFSHYSILGIALDCGFNSKSSFNTAFKKFTGTTPSKFRTK